MCVFSYHLWYSSSRDGSEACDWTINTAFGMARTLPVSDSRRHGPRRVGPASDSERPARASARRPDLPTATGRVRLLDGLIGQLVGIFVGGAVVEAERLAAPTRPPAARPTTSSTCPPTSSCTSPGTEPCSTPARRRPMASRTHDGPAPDGPRRASAICSVPDRGAGHGERAACARHAHRRVRRLGSERRSERRSLVLPRPLHLRRARRGPRAAPRRDDGRLSPRRRTARVGPRAGWSSRRRTSASTTTVQQVLREHRRLRRRSERHRARARRRPDGLHDRARVGAERDAHESLPRCARTAELAGRVRRGSRRAGDPRHRRPCPTEAVRAPLDRTTTRARRHRAHPARLRRRRASA